MYQSYYIYIPATGWEAFSPPKTAIFYEFIICEKQFLRALLKVGKGYQCSFYILNFEQVFFA